MRDLSNNLNKMLDSSAFWICIGIVVVIAATLVVLGIMNKKKK